MQYVTTMKFCGGQNNHHYIIHAKFNDLIMHRKSIMQLTRTKHVPFIMQNEYAVHAVYLSQKLVHIVMSTKKIILKFLEL